MKNINEHIITERLMLKHDSKFIKVPQCKTGATWGSEYLIFDLWVMKKSWVSPLIIGYEIKCSRSDYLNDTKWMNYLEYCNEFYFVTPADLIPKEEMPEGVGLMWLSKTGSRIYTKKKAKYREIEFPEMIIKYIMMSRAYITGYDIIREADGKKKYWENWLTAKNYNRELGYRVSKNLSDVIREKIEGVADKNESLMAENKQLTIIKTYLESIGIDYNNLHSWDREEQIKRRLGEIESGLPEELIDNIKRSIGLLSKIKEAVEDE